MSVILNKAIELAWGAGTPKKKYAYKGGKPTPAFKSAYRAVWGKGVSMKKAANCDRAAATVCRAAGCGKMPSGNKEQLNWKPKKMTRHGYKNRRPIDVAPAGSIVVIKKKNGRHTIIMGSGVFYEATHQKTYLHTRTSLKKIKKKYPKVVVLCEK